MNKEVLEDELILVDLNDEVVGYGLKMDVHKKGLLHRAFSIFIFNDDKLLVQKRALNKYHSGGLIANSCCSHTRRNEELSDATKRRLKEEVGIETTLKEVGTLTYRAVFDNGLIEYELDHIFVGEYDGKFAPNYEEVADMYFIDIDELLVDMKDNPSRYAPWFISALPIALKGRNS